jgi:hypothetical protein
MSLLRGRGSDLDVMRFAYRNVVRHGDLVAVIHTISFHLPFVFYTFKSGFLCLSGNLDNGVSCLPVSASEIVILGDRRLLSPPLALSFFLGNGTVEYVP